MPVIDQMDGRAPNGFPMASDPDRNKPTELMFSLKFQLRERGLITYLTHTHEPPAHTYTATFFTFKTALQFNTTFDVTVSLVLLCFRVYSFVVLFIPRCTGFVYFRCAHVSSGLNLLSLLPFYLCAAFDNRHLFLNSLSFCFIFLSENDKQH